MLKILSIAIAIAAPFVVDAFPGDVISEQQQHPTSAPCDDSGSGGYTKLRDGHATYGFDDGGCYLCAADDHESLEGHCREICDSEPKCVAYTIGRGPSFPVQMYNYEKVANCCLEFREYSPKAYVDASSNDSKRMPNGCQLDAKCWTRYEKKKNGSRRQCNRSEDGSSSSSPPTPAAVATTAVASSSHHHSGTCTEVWPSVIYTESEIDEKLHFISRGCPWVDVTYKSLLARAYTQCQAEIIAESISATVIVLPSSMYTFVSVPSADLGSSSSSSGGRHHSYGRSGLK